MDYKGKGQLIVFEGVDGSGKTTMVDNVVRALEAMNIFPFKFRAPGGTKFGENMRNAIFQSGTEPCNHAVALAMMASHAQLIHEQLIPLLEGGAVVILDRFVESTLSYQGRDEASYALIKDLITKIVPKDLQYKTYILDIPIDVALQRINSRGVENFFDSKQVEFYAGNRERLLTRMKELQAQGQEVFFIRNNVPLEDSKQIACTIAEQISNSLFQK